MPTYTFSCACGWSGDKRTAYGVASVPCPACASSAARESVYPVNFGGFARTPAEARDWSRDYKAFREASEDLAYHESVHTRTEGFAVQGPNYFRAAQATAGDLIRKGAKDVNDLS